MGTTIAPGSLRFEHLREALGIGVARPRISWIVESDVPGWQQRGYELEAQAPDGSLAWSSGRVESAESVLVPWPAEPLGSRRRLQVRVRVWGSDGEVTPWSEPAAVETGLLSPDDWRARFISPVWQAAEDTSRPQPAPFLRHEFDARAEIALARLYITALGVYEAHLNGRPAGDHVLAPGWSSYDRRLRYQTLDVTTLLREGRNAIGVVLGDGWYRGRLGWPGAGGRNWYGSELALLAQLEIVYKDGSRQLVCSDERWRAATGPILASDLYDGETYDARLEQPGWDASGFDDSGWQGVRALERDLGTLVAPSGPPVRRIETLRPARISASPSGRTIIDFGQNLTGRLRFTVRGPAGATVTLRHAEVLEDGELCTRPLRTALAADRYTLRGGGPERWEPRFTFHGFRYAEVDGWPGELRPADIEAVVLHSDMERTGWFECSDPLLNRLHENVVWSMRGNFLDVPTDCPQRDERFGWTGDLQVFAPAASYLYDVAGLLTSWLADLAADQRENGTVPVVVPNPLARSASPTAAVAAAAWSDAAVIVPWVLYRQYGDADILEAQFESMRRWVDAVAAIAGPSRLWDRGFQFGDWLDPLAPPDEPSRAMTDPHLVATAYFARSSELVSRAAAVIGREEEARQYSRLAAEVRAAFRHEFVTPSGRLAGDTQTAHALALQFGLLEGAEQRRRAGGRLASLVRHNRYRIGTGFVGTPLVLDALCDAGEHVIAFRLLSERACPSWLYPVTMGATTIWERWDSLLPNGRVNPGEMTSFNHYALGAVADWLHRRLGGLAPLEPGYRRIEVRPLPGGGITWARARLRTPYGLAACAWRVEGAALALELTVPVSCSAIVVPPGEAATIEAGSGTHRWRLPLASDLAGTP